ncbi:plastid division protein CDP1 chloroplastic [Prunus yedoensis var. nudiflora]|uniref:Plastid division protein CDP1 chloroplastic n=1 Tax=Prunus yedoensis var. nudiflora TaxID=2094558 RepID=A0A314XV23_PRUYE|nr:plastid division protein CDP1 chloroplastic [Prunus yedoensis var. nudiflora]
MAALSHAFPSIPSFCCHCQISNLKEDHKVCVWGFCREISDNEIGVSRVCWKKDNNNLTGRWTLIGVPDQAKKDEVVKLVMDLKSAEIEEGYTMDAVASRQVETLKFFIICCRYTRWKELSARLFNFIFKLFLLWAALQGLLMDVRDELLFEQEYAGNIKEKIPPKSSLRIPWAWLPGALCLLQEVGKVKLVQDIGRVAVQHPDAKLYVHDLLLSMALAECGTAKIGFEKNKVSQGFEALAHAQSLLRSKKSLGKIALLSQIEESLEELAPTCTLELLGIPHSPENAERRRGAIAALCELVRQVLGVETLCRVQNWPCFLSQAFNRLMASEIVDLLPRDDLAITRKNKKSLESQNQRVVINFNCFYMMLIAHIALGFSSKQKELGNEAMVIEKLQKLELNSNSAARNPISGKEVKHTFGANQTLVYLLLCVGILILAVIRSMLIFTLKHRVMGSSILSHVGLPAELDQEMWLKDAILAVFPDPRDCPPSLVRFTRMDC